MKVVRNDLAKTRVSSPTRKPYLKLLALLPIVSTAGLVIVCSGIIALLGVEPILHIIVLYMAVFYGGGVSVMAAITAAVLAKRTLWVDLSADRLMVQHFATYRFPWIEVEHAEIRETDATTAQFCVHRTDGTQVMWPVVLGNGRRHPTLAHYDALVQKIIERASSRENVPEEVPSNLRAMDTSKAVK